MFIILYKINGEFSLRIGYKEKKNFVVIMNDYIIYIFLILTFSFILVEIFIIIKKTVVLKRRNKFLFLLFYSLIYIIHYILFIIKLTYSEFDNSVLSDLEYFFSVLFAFNVIHSIAIMISILCDGKNNPIIFFLKQLKGINIIEYELPQDFDELNEKEKYTLIFGKQLIKKYNYKLNDSQIILISKINNIRKEYNLSIYEYSFSKQLPEFLIDEKTELNFYPCQNIYKLNEGLYIFKYPKNEFQNLLNNKEILNIITNDLLDKIYIIKQKNFEFICFYSNNNIYDKISYPLYNKNNNFNLNKMRH